MAMTFSATRLKKSIFPYVTFLAEMKVRDAYIRQQSQSISILEYALKKNVVPMAMEVTKSSTFNEARNMFSKMFSEAATANITNEPPWKSTYKDTHLAYKKIIGGSLLWHKTSRLVLRGCASLHAASFLRETGSIADNSSLANPLVRCARLYATSINDIEGSGGPAESHKSSYMELSGLMGTRFYKTFEDFIADGKEILADYDSTRIAYDISDVLKILIRDMVNQIKLIHDNGFHFNDINVKKFDVYIENYKFVLKIKGDVSDLKQNFEGSVENDLVDLGGLLQDIITDIRQQLSTNNKACNPNFGYDLEDFAIILAAKKSLDNFTGHPFFYDIGCKFSWLIWAVQNFRNLEYNEIEMAMTHFRRRRQQKLTFWEPRQFQNVLYHSVYDLSAQGFMKCFRNVLCRPLGRLLNVCDGNRDINVVERYFRSRCPEFFCVSVYALHNLNTNYYKNSWPENLPKPF